MYVESGHTIAAHQKLEATGNASPYLESVIHEEVRDSADLFDACIAAGATPEEIRVATGETEDGEPAPAA